MNTLSTPTAKRTPNPLTLKGSIETVKFSAPDSGWCSLHVRCEDGSIANVVGTAIKASVGENVDCRGQWENHSKFGKQFKAEMIINTPPTNADALEKYLSSGAVEGIGPHYARKLVSAFGSRLPEMLTMNPNALEIVKGIGPERKRKILSSWHKHVAIRQIMIFLQEIGLGPQRAAQIYKRYGDRAVGLLRSNPYRLVDDFTGVGFKTADQVAVKMGTEQDAPQRLEAGIQFVLRTHRLRGHTAVDDGMVLKDCRSLLGVDTDAIQLQIDKSVISHEVVRHSARLYIPALHAAESNVAARLQRIREAKPPWRFSDASASVTNAALTIGLTLSPSQTRALEATLAASLSVITGGPGTGKTTITRVLTQLLNSQRLEVVLCAPTGRAARRLSQATRCPASTIHRLLMGESHSRHFIHNERNPLRCDVIVADEASMIDIELMAALTAAMPARCALILIGDVDQLPSVGPGQVLADCINSNSINVVRLTEVHRQAACSHIIANAHRVLQGEVPRGSNYGSGDFHIEELAGAEEIADRLCTLIAKELPTRFNVDPLDSIQVLTPMHRGVLGTNALNQRLQSLLNPHGVQHVLSGDRRFAVGDRVLQLRNNLELGISNGDTGRITSIDAQEKLLSIHFDETVVRYPFEDVDDLSLSYAMTCHKIQGSEAKIVVIPIAAEHYVMLSRRLLYTAITRGREHVILLVEPRALRMAVGNGKHEHRVGGLRERLTAADIERAP